VSILFRSAPAPDEGRGLAGKQHKEIADMSHPIRLAAIVVLLFGFLVTPNAPSPAQTAPAEKPNVLVIITDDQRTGTLGVMNDTRRWLPVDYPQAFVTTPLCCPSRASIMTGRYAHNHGVTRLGGDTLDQSTTIQHHLDETGYRTGFFGKPFVGQPLTEAPPVFDQYAMIDFPLRYYDSNWGFNTLPSGEQLAVHRTNELSGYTTQLLGRYGESFIEDNSDQPWMMYLSTSAPHLPYTPQFKYRDAPVGQWNGNPGVFEAAPKKVVRYRLGGLTKPMKFSSLSKWIRRHPSRVRNRTQRGDVAIQRIVAFNRNLSDKPPYIRRGKLTLEDGRFRRAQQLRTLMSVDDMVERVMSTLEVQGELDNTLVVFVSDNGYMWGEHGRRGKLVPYRESIQVPMLARYPGLATKPKMVGNIDIAPTVMDAAGLPIPETMDGHSLLDPSWQGRDQMLSEHWCTTSPNTCLRWSSVRHVSGWQYIENYDDAGRITFREFYRSDDPYQLDNVLRTGPARERPSASRLDQLHDWMVTEGSNPTL
jgi:arylsulfatase A-like enzyme